MKLSDRVNQIEPSITIAITSLATDLKNKGKNIVSLSMGEPDFDTPEPIKQAAIQAIQSGQTKYTPVDGTPALKTAIQQKFARENNLEYSLNQIIASNGAKQAIYNALQALINPGDEVLVPAPYWVSYPDMIRLASGKPVIIDTTMESNFKITAKQLKSAINSKTKLLLLNSPSNPTGKSYTAQEYAELATVLKKHPNLYILLDDIYEHILWTPEPFVNLLNVAPELSKQTLVINGVSKAYAMTGWRIGYSAGPEPWIKAMKKLQSQSTSNPCSIAQAAAAFALNNGAGHIPPMVKAYRERHDYLVKELNLIPGVTCIPADGTFYAFPNIEKLLKTPRVKTDLQLTQVLLEEAQVAVVPGSAFGAPGHLRFSFATSLENLKTAVSRIRPVFENLFLN